MKKEKVPLSLCISLTDVGTWQEAAATDDVHFEQVLVKFRLIAQQHLHASPTRRMQRRHASLEQPHRSV